MTPPIKDISGQVFGEYTVLGMDADRAEDGSVFWICQCSCGQVRRVTGTVLRRKQARSCGCARNKHISEANAHEPGLAAFNALLTRYRREAAQRGYVFELSEDQFRQLTGRACSYCGAEPQQRDRKFSTPYLYTGIDRVDNTQGYTWDNCVSCCGTCNSAKKQMTVSEFIGWARRLVSYQEQP